jgi:protein-S-isoprenylcysteine O-methyltransferase Ste14
MKERSKAAIIVLIICICGVVVPQTLPMTDKSWGDAMSFFSTLGAIIAFFFALVAIWQDGEQD